MSVRKTSGGEVIPFMQLPPEHIDLVDSALRFSLIESCVAKFKIPVLIDDPYLSFDNKKRMLLSQMLGYIGSVTQVILLSEKQDVTGNPIQI
jgi:uncharacterized protein YhaN